MGIQIFTLKFDINCCYIIRSKKGMIMIDGGPPGKKKSFQKQLSKHHIDPREIKLMVLTHGDFDHIGSARDFMEITGAKIAIHKNDRPNLEEGIMKWPHGVTLWGKISKFILKPFISAISTVPLVKPDIILNDNEFTLNDFGLREKSFSHRAIHLVQLV